MTGIKGSAMMTGMTEDDLSIVLEVFEAAQSRRGDRGTTTAIFGSALHYSTRCTTSPSERRRRSMAIGIGLEAVLAARPLG